MTHGWFGLTWAILSNFEKLKYDPPVGHTSDIDNFLHIVNGIVICKNKIFTLKCLATKTGEIYSKNIILLLLQ